MPSGDKPHPLFSDEDYMDRLVKILAYDAASLRQCAPLVKPDDFKPLAGQVWGRSRWNVAARVLDYYRRQLEPVGDMIRAEMLSYADKIQLSERQTREIEEYLDRLRAIPVGNPAGVVEKIVSYKEDRLRALVLEEMTHLQAAGQLSKDKWMHLSSKALRNGNGTAHSVDYYATYEDRIMRREWRAGSRMLRPPAFLIDPLDELVKGVGPGQLGLVIAPTGRGKSLWMAWSAFAFSAQGYNVILFTLEDPREELEERLDALISAMPLSDLSSQSKEFRERFVSYRRRNDLMKAKLRIVDGTEDGLTVEQIESAMLAERQGGFQADILLIDYDDEITPTVRHRDRRMDSDEIYRELRRMAARHRIIVWTAAQTQRGTENLKILTGSKVAEDIGKIRKSTMAIGLGKGDWGGDSMYVWVFKHKFDRSRVGCHIIPDLPRMMIYDGDATYREQKVRDGEMETMEEEAEV